MWLLETKLSSNKAFLTPESSVEMFLFNALFKHFSVIPSD